MGLSEVRMRELLTRQREAGEGKTLTGLLSTSLSAVERVPHAGRIDVPRAVGVWKHALLKLER